MARQYHVYIMLNSARGYHVGVTGHLYRRWLEHRTSTANAQSREPQFTRLVYAESFAKASEAAVCQQRLKKLQRQRKARLIESVNPGARDLAVIWGWRAKPVSMMVLGLVPELERVG